MAGPGGRIPGETQNRPRLNPRIPFYKSTFMKPENLTAWALNELSDEEKAQIESLLNEDADVQKQAAQTKTFCDFLTAELGDDSLAFTPEQRERLWSADEPSASSPSAQAAPAFAKRTSFWRRHAVVNLAAAAAVVLGTTVLIRRQVEEEGRMAEAVVSPARPQKVKEGAQDDGSLATGAPMPSEVLKPTQRAANSDRGDAEGSESKMDMAGGLVKNANKQIGQSRSEGNKGEKDLAAVGVDARKRSLSEANEAWENAPSGAAAAWAAPAARPAPADYPAFAVASATTSSIAGTMQLGSESADQPAPAMPGGPPATLAAHRRNSFSITTPRPLPEPEDFGNRPDPSSSNESYTQIIENVLKDVVREPLSTFSIDVDTASYANVRRFLNQNSAPPRDAVRIEELINYFPTDEEGPAADTKEPFAVKVEMAACPWQPQHRLARIAIQGKQIGADRQPSNLVFLVDVSGSMGEPNKLPLVQQSLRMLTEQLGENDRVSMVTYAGGTQVVLPPTNGMAKSEIIAAIDRLQSGGGTHGSAGIRLAYEQAVAGFIKGGVNRVILCSDGDFNVGISDPKELETYITEKARSGVFLSLLGYGSGNLKDRTMETLADKGNGNYAYIDSLGEARKVLVEQMNGTLVTIAKDVKIQVEFNPAVIRSYRLIGYENRLLAKEDFNDDTKDAGEIGAGHSVTALYELVPANLPPGTDPRPLVDGLKYQPAAPAAPAPAAAAAPASDEALTVKLRYKQPEGSTSSLIELPVRDNARRLDTASAEFQFTTAVAGFGMLLRQSSYAGQLTWEQVRQMALAGKGSDPLGYRGEFIQLIEKARGVSGQP